MPLATLILPLPLSVSNAARNVNYAAKIIYSALECADGDCVSTENTYPSSRLYKFISDLYSLHDGVITPSDFPCIDAVYTSTKYVGKDGVDLDSLPAFLQKRYSEVIVSGHRYRFNWGKMKNDPKGRQSVENPDGIFMKEYLAIKSLPEKLSAELAPVSNNPFAHFHYMLSGELCAGDTLPPSSKWMLLNPHVKRRKTRRIA